MSKQFGYKKYMKKDVQKDNSLIKIFIISFFGMLLVFTFLIKSFTPTVDTSIGEYRVEEQVDDNSVEENKIVDNRLEMIQSEDQGRNFSEIIEKSENNTESNAEELQKKDNEEKIQPIQADTTTENPVIASVQTQEVEPIYKVYVGAYTSAEQAKVAKDIIVESGNGLNPIVKCIGSNNYTLQVGIFKNKKSAESLLITVQQNHLPGRIVQEY